MSAGETDESPRGGPPHEHQPKGGRRPRRPLTPQRMLFTCGKLALGIVVLAIVGAGILALRLQSGPIEIDGLGDKIAGALHERFGNGLVFGLGRTAMVQRGFGPTLTIDKLAVSGPDGQTILSAPKAEVSIDPFALVVGKVVPRRLEVMDVTLRLVLLKNGALAVAAGDGTKPFAEIGRRSDAAAAPAPASSPAELSEATAPNHRAVVMKQAAAALRQFLDVLTDPQSPIAAVDRLGIDRGTLVIDDETNGDVVVYKGLDLAFDRAHGVTNFSLSAEGPNGRWSVAAMAKGIPGQERRFGVKVDNLTVDELQLAAGSRSLGVETDMPIAASADIVLKPDNTLSEAAGGFKLGPGFVRTADPDQEPILIKELAGAARWQPASRTIEIDPSRYVESTGTRPT